MSSRSRWGLAAMLGVITVTTGLAGIPKTKSTGSLELVSLTPLAGTVVERGSIITAKLRFSIDNFQHKKDKYAVSISFQGSQSRTSTFQYVPGGVVMVGQASGTVDLSFPLESVWDDPRLARPLVVYFYLHERTDKHTSVVLSSTEGTRYPVRQPDQFAEGEPDRGEPASAAAVQAATELLRAMHVEKSMMGGAAAMADVMIQNDAALGPYRDVILEWAGSFMTWATFGPRLVAIYSESFTESELRTMADFYTTPTGQKALALMPELMHRCALLGIEVAKDHQGELEEMVRKRAAEIEQSKPQEERR